MGGSDDPANLKDVTIEEHAEAHRKLYEKHGHWQDKVAWLGLSKMIDKQELIAMILSESKRNNPPTNLTKEHRAKGGKTSARLYPERPSLGGKALWSKPGMREHLSQKRKEQTNRGMLGKTHSRVSCLCCKREWSVNTFPQHLKSQF